MPDLLEVGEAERGFVSALRLVAETVAARSQDYDIPERHWRAVAAVWRATFGWDVDAHSAALAMAQLKIVREAFKHQQDNIVDGMAYLDIAERCADR